MAEAYRLDSPTLMGYRHLARTHLKASNIHNDALHDAALGEFCRQPTYKCTWHGSELWATDRWCPSSKICFLCRMKNAGLLRSASVFRCEHCGLVLDRDFNAAKNLAALTEFVGVCLMAQLINPVSPSSHWAWYRTKTPAVNKGVPEPEAKRPMENCERSPATVLLETTLLIGKSLSPPTPSLVMAESHTAPTMRWFDASGICPCDGNRDDYQPPERPEHEVSWSAR